MDLKPIISVLVSTRRLTSGYFIRSDYGFDPLGLGKEPTNLARFQEAELIHARWAMLGVSGAAGAEVITGVNWVEAPVQAQQSYLGNTIPFPLPVIAAIEVFVMAYVESKRGSETDRTKRMYPGGSFDPAGFSKGADFEKLKRKELANGRVAMLAFAGIIGEAQANNLEGPVAALSLATSQILARECSHQCCRGSLPLKCGLRQHYRLCISIHFLNVK